MNTGDNAPFPDYAYADRHVPLSSDGHRQVHMFYLLIIINHNNRQQKDGIPQLQDLSLLLHYIWYYQGYGHDSQYLNFTDEGLATNLENTVIIILLQR